MHAWFGLFLTKFSSNYKLEKLNIAIGIRIPAPTEEFKNSYFIKEKSKLLGNCSSKEIREGRTNKTPILQFKLGLNLDTRESLDWGYKINKLSSTRHKNILLRVVHGDVYTKDKLYRYGMEPSNKCPRCDQIEDLKHKFISCEYISRIWRQVSLLENKLISDRASTNVRERFIVGAFTNSTKAFLTLTAEILSRITGLQNDPTYLVRPKNFVDYAIKSLAIRENDEKIKTLYFSMLNGD